MRSRSCRFDLEALRRLDVFQIDAAEGRLQGRHHLDEALRIQLASSSMSKTSMPANFLKRTALPSITGLEASGPMAPSPSTAVPLVTTADQVTARRVAAEAWAGSSAMASQAEATPGE